MKKIMIASISFYQKYLSFDRGLLRLFSLGLPVCRFYPTCSEYTKTSIQRFGIVKGSWLGLARIVRCHPFSLGGLDPVPWE